VFAAEENLTEGNEPRELPAPSPARHP
jgi:hypothetical protein